MRASAKKARRAPRQARFERARPHLACPPRPRPGNAPIAIHKRQRVCCWLYVRVVVFVLAKGLVLHARRETIPWQLNACGTEVGTRGDTLELDASQCDSHYWCSTHNHIVRSVHRFSGHARVEQCGAKVHGAMHAVASGPTVAMSGQWLSHLVRGAESCASIRQHHLLAPTNNALRRCSASCRQKHRQC